MVPRTPTTTKGKTMSQDVAVETTAVIRIDVEDRILSQMLDADTVKVILRSRNGQTVPVQLSYRSRIALQGES